MADQATGVGARGDSFNSLELLGLERDEVRHTRLIAWLLDPGETHGQGAAFLAAFTGACGLAVAGGSSADLEVHPEFGGLNSIPDIAVICPGEFVLLIENKIGAGPGVNQLDREEADLTEIKDRVRASQGWCIYLSDAGSIPAGTGPSWRGLKYSDLAAAFRALPLADGKLKNLVDDLCDSALARGRRKAPPPPRNLLPTHWDDEFAATIARVQQRVGASVLFQGPGWVLKLRRDVDVYVSLALDKGGEVAIGLWNLNRTHAVSSTDPTTLWVWVPRGSKQQAATLRNAVRPVLKPPEQLGSGQYVVKKRVVQPIRTETPAAYMALVESQTLEFFERYATALTRSGL